MLPDATSPSFPAALKSAREAAGLNRSQLARQAQIHPVMPRRYEEQNDPDFTRPTPKTWKALNTALGFNPNPSPKPLLSEASVDQIVAELRSRGASVTLSFA
jgi:ribosome-binding protein aMBF1 (putative translation factor)